jgi:outer membrane protein TolC
MQDQRKLELDQAMNDLAFWIGKKMTADEIKLEVPVVDQVKLPPTDDNFKNIDLIFAKNQLESSRTDLSLVKKERLPDLFLGGGYRVENVVPANHFSYGIIGLNIPLWDTGSNRVESAKSREVRDQKLFEETTRKTSLNLEKQKEQVLYQYEQLKRFQFKNVRKQEDDIHNAERGFKQGFLDVVTFLQAEIQTHEVIDQIFISWMDYLEAMSTLQLLRGESFQWTK